MSIYIAIPSFLDNQLPFTVQEAIENASNPQDISIGLVFMEVPANNGLSESEFFNNKVLPLKRYPQIQIKHFKVGEYTPSIGFGRNTALSMYNNEDYILQIDSHTMFDKDWDTKLVDMFTDAVKETKNEKTILTSYLPSYEHDDAGMRDYYNRPRVAKYCFFIKDFKFAGGLPSWEDKDLVHEPSFLRGELFLPAVKFSAQFAFSNKHFYEYSGLPETTIFWEEELIQTMNLLDAGFSLVSPNQVVPISHLYLNNVNFVVESDSYRLSGANPKLLSKKEYADEIKQSYLTFVKDPSNKDKIDRFYKYAKVHPIYGPYMERYIPPAYNR